MSRDPVADVLARLTGVRRSGDGWTAQCPCRADDRNPSLTVGTGHDGRALLRCHRGDACDTAQICAAIGLDVSDLFTDEPPRRNDPGPLRLTATYPYVDATGELVFEVRRFVDAEGRKTFRQRCPDPNEATGWKNSTAHLVDKPLFRLPQVLAAVADGRPVAVVEGEKDVLALEAVGVVATCNPGGAGGPGQRKWLPSHTAALAGAKVVVVADNDPPGHAHAAHVAAELRAAGCEVRTRICPAPHKDVADLLGAGGRVGDLLDWDPGPVAEDEALAEPVPGPLHALLDDLSRLLERDVPPEMLAARVHRLVEQRLPQHHHATPGRLLTWEALVDENVDDAYQWLIPGLLERGERVMIVAAEGVGKTMLARQVAICAAAGIHPFTWADMARVRTLFVDLENPERIIRRTARRILATVRSTYRARDLDAHLWVKPDGINVLRPADRVLLEEHLDTTRPELLVLGPLYKAFIDPGNRTAEAVATEVAMYFDYLRAAYGVALWLEHHAPLGNSLAGRDLRPQGSAVWMRWPEFGYALAPGMAADPMLPQGGYVLRQWRGPRDERAWPTVLKRGEAFPFEVVSYDPV